MKPIAHIYWISDKGNEQSLAIHDKLSLTNMTKAMKRENVCYWVCMLSVDVSIPA